MGSVWDRFFSGVRISYVDGSLVVSYRSADGYARSGNASHVGGAYVRAIRRSMTRNTRKATQPQPRFSEPGVRAQGGKHDENSGFGEMWSRPSHRRVSKITLEIRKFVRGGVSSYDYYHPCYVVGLFGFARFSRERVVRY